MKFCFDDLQRHETGLAKIIQNSQRSWFASWTLLWTHTQDPYSTSYVFFQKQHILLTTYLGSVQPLQLLLLGLSPGSFLYPPCQLGIELLLCVGFLKQHYNHVRGLWLMAHPALWELGPSQDRTMEPLCSQNIQRTFTFLQLRDQRALTGGTDIV